MDVSSALSIIAFIIQQEPKVEQALRNVFTKPNPTAADWQSEHDAWASDTYEKLVPDSQLPPDPPTQSS
jgi:hypothetical protein